VAEPGSIGSLAIVGYDDPAHDISSVGAEIAKRLGKIMRMNIADGAASCERRDIPGTAPGG